MLLSNEDIAWLNHEATFLDDASESPSNHSIKDITSRVIINNSTEGQALQINGPIGEIGWREVSHLEIRNNRATGSSIQLNHATSIDVFKQMLAARAADGSG